MGKAERILLLEKELEIYNKVAGEASDIIIEQGVSNYPIIVAHQDEINFGLPLVDKNKTKGNWNLNASTLEEFVVKNILHQDKVNNFRSTYKDSSEFICLFVLSELGANFLFMPRKKSK